MVVLCDQLRCSARGRSLLKYLFANRVVAQLGRALGSGPRGRWFKSSQPDHECFRSADSLLACFALGVVWQKSRFISYRAPKATFCFTPDAKRHTPFHTRCQTPRSTSLFLPKTTYLFTPKKSTCANVRSFEIERGF